MPIFLPTTSDTIDVVWSDDPSVKAPKGVDGWVPVKTKGLKVETDADVVTVRPLNGRERFRAASGDEQVDRIYDVCQAGTTAHNGKNGDALKQWVDWLPPTAASDLCIYILGISRGEEGGKATPGVAAK